MTEATSSKRTEVLLLMLALIGLTCAATTLIDDDDLKELKENIQTLKQETQRKRVSNMVDSAFLPDFASDFGHLLDPLSKLLKSIEPFSPLLDLIPEFNPLIKECKIRTEQIIKNEDAKIRENVEKLQQLEKLIMTLEEWNS